MCGSVAVWFSTLTEKVSRNPLTLSNLLGCPSTDAGGRELDLRRGLVGSRDHGSRRAGFPCRGPDPGHGLPGQALVVWGAGRHGGLVPCRLCQGESLCGQGGVWWLCELSEGRFPAAFVRVVFVWTGRSVVAV